MTPANIPPQLLRQELAGRCDAFVVPDVVLAFDRLPLTSNGKVDTAALKKNLDQRTQSMETGQQLSDDASTLDIVKHGFSTVLETPLSQIHKDSSFWDGSQEDTGSL